MTVLTKSQSSWDFTALMTDIVKRLTKAKTQRKELFQSDAKDILGRFLNALPNGEILTDGYYRGFTQERRGKDIRFDLQQSCHPWMNCYYCDYINQVDHDCDIMNAKIDLPRLKICEEWKLRNKGDLPKFIKENDKEITHLNDEITTLKAQKYELNECLQQMRDLDTMRKNEISRLDSERKKWEADAVRLGRESIKQDEEIARLELDRDNWKVIGNTYEDIVFKGRNLVREYVGDASINLLGKDSLARRMLELLGLNDSGFVMKEPELPGSDGE